MAFSIRCVCGQTFDVPAGRAGTQLPCSCGRTLTVPPLSELRKAADAGQMCLAEEYRQPAATADAAGDDVPREFFMILAPDHVIAQRVHQEAFVHFVAAFDRTLKSFVRKTEAQQGVDVQIGYAMFPGDRRLIDLQIHPETLPPHVVAELRMELEELRQPPVEGGPVSFCCRTMLWGGANDRHPPFLFPFSRQFTRRAGSFDKLLMEAAGLAPDRRGSSGGAAASRGKAAGVLLSFLRRAARWLGGTSRRPAAEPRVATPDPAVAPPETRPPIPDPADPARGYTLEELTALIARYPRYAPLYGLRAELFEQREEYDRAIEDYTAWLALRPAQAEIYSRRAMACCAAGNQQQGLKDLTAALQLDPAHVAALAGRGMIYLQLGAWDQALADFDAAIDRDRRNPSLQLQRGRVLIARGDYPRAVEALTQALRLDPNHDAAHAWRALARRRASATPSDEVIRAMLADFDNAIEIQPDHAGYHLYRAEVRLGAGDFSGAAADCGFVLAREPESGEAHALRGIARQRLGDSAGAVEDCTAAIEHDAASDDVYVARAFAHEDLGNADEALSDCDAALELDPQDAVACNLRGTIRLKLGDVDEAAEDFEAAVQMQPDWALPYANRGNICRARGDNEGAVREYSRALQLDPQLVFAHLNRALAWADQQEDEKALEDFAAAVRIAPEIAGAYVERAWLRMRREEYDAALADLSEALRLQPDLAPAWFHRGRLHLQQGNYDEALRDFDRLIDLVPDLAAAYSSRGSVWIQKGEQDKADADFQQAIVCEPGMAEAFAIERLLLEAAYHGRREEFDEAVSRATEAIEMDEECLPAYAIRAGAYWYSEQSVEAIDDFTRLIAENEDDFHALAGRGQVYAELGEFDLALTDLGRAIALGRKRGSKTGLAYAYNGRALALAGLGRLEEALRDFDRSLRDAPGNAWLHYNRGVVFHHLGRHREAAACFQQALDKTDPALPPKKRERARGFLRRFAE
ncbi:MAG TPA: tetratricopeptide repeat protein [Candidatus Anammoximicrobium sp.]|nr:tetratricopeptide repeat protein [Candidatus Anammoximicrobium sp.]